MITSSQQIELFAVMEEIIKTRSPSRRLDLFVRWIPLIKKQAELGCGQFLWVVGNYDDRLYCLEFPGLEDKCPDEQRAARIVVDEALNKIVNPVLHYWYKWFFLISLNGKESDLNGSVIELDRETAESLCERKLQQEMPCPPRPNRSSAIVVVDEIYFNQVLLIVDREGLLIEFQKGLELLRNLDPDKQYYQCLLQTGLTACSFFCKTQHKSWENEEWKDGKIFTLTFHPGTRSWKID